MLICVHLRAVYCVLLYAVVCCCVCVMSCVFVYSKGIKVWMCFDCGLSWDFVFISYVMFVGFVSV